MAFETRTGDRTATELLGAGDLLQPPELLADDLLERSVPLARAAPDRLALLDEDFVERVRPFPQIARALLRRAVPATAELDVLRAITSQPRLEVRLVLLLWHLAARWGRVEPAASGCRCRSPTGCSASSWPPSGRRSRTPSSGSRTRGW